MKKRALCMLLVLSMIISLAPTKVSASSTDDSSGLLTEQSELDAGKESSSLSADPSDNSSDNKNDSENASGEESKDGSYLESGEESKDGSYLESGEDSRPEISENSGEESSEPEEEPEPSAYSAVIIGANVDLSKQPVELSFDADGELWIEGEEEPIPYTKDTKLSSEIFGSKKLTLMALEAPTVTLFTPEDGSIVSMSSSSKELSEETPDATFFIQQPLVTKQLFMHWQDGALEEKPELAPLSLQFKTADSEWIDLTEEIMASFGYTELAEIPEPVTGASEYIYNFDMTLLPYRLAENEMGETVLQEVSYRLKEETAPEGYAKGYLSTDDSIVLNTLKVPFEASIQWHDASNKYATRIDEAAWSEGGVLYRTTDDEEAQIVPMTSLLGENANTEAEGYLVFTDEGNNCYTIKLDNALGFDEEGNPYTYYLVQQEELAVDNESVGVDGAFYAAEYQNEGNYASITNALYAGGVLVNSLEGERKFEAVKIWRDDGEADTIAQRPSAVMDLLRYPDNGSNYTSASPVPGVASTKIDQTKEAQEAISIVIPGGEAMLPMFNEDGYLYIYYAKETLSGGGNTYQQVFVNNGALDGSNRYLFDGGELNNTITGTVDLKTTKKWLAASRQDVDAEVELALYQKDPNTGEEIVYQTKTISGFSAEITEKEVDFGGLPKYNEEGLRYEYRVAEQSVSTKVGGAFSEATVKEEDGKIYIVTQDGYRYLQTIKYDENGNCLIENTLVGNARVKISKTFADGLIDQKDVTATYTIYRDGAAIGTKTVTYKAADHPEVPFVPETLIIESYEDMDEGSYTGCGLLPRYDQNGKEYRYKASETKIVSEATYGKAESDSQIGAVYGQAEERANEQYALSNTIINNHKPGEGLWITVYKQWKDAEETIYRQTVMTALQIYDQGAWTTIAQGSIATNTDHTVIKVPTQYEDKYRAWFDLGHDQTQETEGAFRVIETALGKDTVQEDSPLIQDEHPGHDPNYSFVATKDQEYDVSPTAEYVNGHYELLNRRVGVVRVQWSKKWTDGKNTSGTRPDSVTFTVSSSQKVFTDENGDSSNTKEFTIDASSENEFLSKTSNDTEWFFSTDWLPKYDSNGNVITYSVSETRMNYSGTDYSERYVQSMSYDSYLVGERHTKDVATYSFANTLAGSVRPYVNEYWADMHDQAAINRRPDIFPVLIRTYIDADGVTHEELMSFQERDWNTEVESRDWWKCTFVEQPRYNSEGYEYTYYIGNKFASAVTNDYFISGAYKDEPFGGKYIEPGLGADESEKVTITINGTSYYGAKLDNETGASGTIVIKPEATLTVSGSKIWANLPAGFSKAYLPDVTFGLKRYSYEPDGTPQTIEDAVVVNNTEKTQATTGLPSGASRFSFAGTYPKYDEYGRYYTYVIEELEPENINVAYTIKNQPGTGLTVTNSYNSNQNFDVHFEKIWEGMENETIPASATLSLVRYLTDAKGKVIEASKETQFATLAQNGHDNQVVVTSDVSQINWLNLSYYAPNGRPYVYRVEETKVTRGFVVYKNETSKLEAVNGTYVIDIQTDSFDKNTGEGNGSGSVINRYGEVLGSVKTEKKWATLYDITVHPDTIKVTLFRTSKAAGKEAVTTYELTKDQEYKLKIDDLEIYAPNDEIYSYSLEEVDENGVSTTLTGYSVKTSTAVQALAPNASYSNLKTITITNSPLTETIKVNKQFTVDGVTLSLKNVGPTLRALDALPTKVTIKVIAKIEGEDTWQTIKTINGADVEWVLSVNNDGTISGTPKTWTLPQYTVVTSENGTQTTAKITYKAAESKITYKDGTELVLRSDDDAFNGDDSNILFGSITSSSETTNGISNVTNSIPVKTVTITKVWNDENNRDGNRPSSIDFTLTRTGIMTEADSASITVRLTQSDALASPGNSGQNVWQKQIVVPVYLNTDRTKKSTYSVTEKASATDGYTHYIGTDTDAAATEEASFNANEVAPTFEEKAAGALKVDLTSEHQFANFLNAETLGNEKITLTPAKTWSIAGTSYSAENQNVPEWLGEYLPETILFKLQYRLAGTASWKDADGTGDFEQVASEITADVDQTTGRITVGDFENVPRYSSTTNVTKQTAYEYRIVEQMSEPQTVFFTAKNGASISSASCPDNVTLTTVNTFALTSIKLEKEWDDSDNIYNTRPLSITYRLNRTSNGSVSQVPESWLSSQSLTALKKDAYGMTLKDLPMYDSEGNLITYTAEEMTLNYAAGVTVTPGEKKVYNVTVETTTQGQKFTNTLNPVTLRVEKTWNDLDNVYGLRPSTVTFAVQRKVGVDGSYADYIDANGDLVVIIASVQKDGKLSNNSITDLPLVDENGSPLFYRAVEKTFEFNDGSKVDRVENVIGAYSVTAEETRIDTEDLFVTNVANTLDQMSVTVRKHWDDAQSEGAHRGEVTIELLQNDVRIDEVQIESEEADENGDASKSFTELPVRDALGESYRYTVNETAIVNGYVKGVITEETNVSAGDDLAYAVTNTETALAFKSTELTASGDQLLEGACYTVTANEEDGRFTENGQIIDTKTVLDQDAENTLCGEFTGGQSYTVKETKTPDGFVKIADFEFTVDEVTGEITLADNAPEGAVLSEDRKTLIIRNVPNRIDVSKEDQNGNRLDGAVFKLSPANAEDTFVDAEVPISFAADEGIETVIGKLRQGKIYVLTETVPPQGYRTAKDIYLKLDDNGAVYQSASADGSFSKLENTTVRVIDRANEITFESYAPDQTTPVESTYVITGTFADGTSSKQVSHLGELTGMLIAGETYTVTETADVPDTLVTIDPFTFTVDNNGAITAALPNGADTGTVTVEDGPILRVIHVAMRNKVRLTKVDAVSQSPLQNVVFTLTKTEDQTQKATYTTDENGQILIEDLSKGTYTITETTTDPNYINSEFEASFVVNDDCFDQELIIATAAVQKDPFKLSITKDEEHLQEDALTNDRVLGRIQVVKFKEDDQTPLSGASFGLYQEDENGESIAVNEGVTDDDGLLSFTDLPWGTYLLKETATPEGYYLDGTTVKITIEYDALTHRVEIVNDLNVFTLRQEGVDGALAGAAYAVEGEFVNGNTEETMLDGNTDQTVLGNLAADKSYTFTQTAIPEGYLPVEPFTITMQKDGTVTAEKLPEGVAFTEDRKGIVVTNKQSDLSVIKVNASNEKIEDAVLSLEGRFASQNQSIIWTSSINDPETADDGRFVGLLIAGESYTLKELEAPQGQIREIGEFVFTLQNDGTITAEEGQDENFTIGDDRMSITLVNDSLSPQIVKIDQETKDPIEGAIFEVRGAFTDGSEKMSGTAEELTAMLSGKVTATKMVEEQDGTLQLPEEADMSIYTLTEIAAPKGYRLETRSARFIVKQDGTVLLLDEEDTFVEQKDEHTICFADTKIKTSFTKINEEKEPLNGAVFLLEGELSDGKTSMELTVSDKGLELEGLLIGSTKEKTLVYTLTELSAPSGYDTIDVAIRFSLDESGKITLIDSAKGAAAVSEDGFGLIVTDQKTLLPKTGEHEPITLFVLTMLLSTAGAWLAYKRKKRFAE